eukprot:scaffold8563_cov97-Isochrysis_galbana.AAC.1
MQRRPSPSHSTSLQKWSTSLNSITSSHSLQPRCSSRSDTRKKGFRACSGECACGDVSERQRSGPARAERQGCVCA